MAKGSILAIKPKSLFLIQMTKILSITTTSPPFN